MYRSASISVLLHFALHLALHFALHFRCTLCCTFRCTLRCTSRHVPCAGEPGALRCAAAHNQPQPEPGEQPQGHCQCSLSGALPALNCVWAACCAFTSDCHARGCQMSILMQARPPWAYQCMSSKDLQHIAFLRTPSQALVWFDTDSRGSRIGTAERVPGQARAHAVPTGAPDDLRHSL